MSESNIRRLDELLQEIKYYEDMADTHLRIYFCAIRDKNKDLIMSSMSEYNKIIANLRDAHILLINMSEDVFTE